MFSRAAQVYQRSLQTYPVFSQAVQVGVLMGCGDLISQKIVEKKEYVNWTRTAKFASVGFIFVVSTINYLFILHLHTIQIN